MSDMKNVLARALWDSVDDRGIAGRVFREDCDYLAGVAIEVLRPMAEILKPSSVWEKELGAVILDPDGWDRRNFFTSWAEPITRDEFKRRMAASTAMRMP